MGLTRAAALRNSIPGCKDIIVLADDKQPTVFAERMLGKATRWKQVAELNRPASRRK